MPLLSVAGQFSDFMVVMVVVVADGTHTCFHELRHRTNPCGQKLQGEE